MANADPPTAGTAGPSPEDQRHELQGILGEYHGLLTTIVDRLPGLAQGVELAQDEEMMALIRAIENAFPGV